VTSATVTAASSVKTARTATVKASASMKTSTEARLPAHGVVSGHPPVIKTAERAGMCARLALSC